MGGGGILEIAADGTCKPWEDFGFYSGGEVE
jgi:hypothetical protein